MESQPKPRQQYVSRSNQFKRQREWVYLSHYLAILGLTPSRIISGADDGLEPDFTLVLDRESKPYYIGIELTTLPRLRDQMGDNGLIAKRWYWQSLLVVAAQQQVSNCRRFRLPLSTVYMPEDRFNKQYDSLPLSLISQSDIDAVMAKKAHKIKGYYTRRPLDELWLLIHTDKYQPNSILASPRPHTKTKKNGYKQIAGRRLNNLFNTQLTYANGFNQVHISRYPSHKLLNVQQILKTSNKKGLFGSQANY